MENIVNPENTCSDLYKKTQYREDALNYMLQMQRDLQVYIGNKRGNKHPLSEMTDQARADEAIYFWGCATTEWYELIDSRDKYLFIDNSEKQKLEMQYELIDIWHFLMNVFLYTGIDSSEATLADVYNQDYIEDTIEHHWAELSYWVGNYINSLPYKHWKTYKEYKIDDKELANCFSNILTIFVHIAVELGIDKEKFFDLYVSKNAENIERQNNESKNYI